MYDYDAIVVGAGVAGLGQAALLQQAGRKTLLVERWPRTGGRLQPYPQKDGYIIENGLHIVEMGKKGYCHEMAARAGVEIEWGSWTSGGEFYMDGGWVPDTELLKQSEGVMQSFVQTLTRIAAMQDADFAAWDNRSVTQWLDSEGISGQLRVLWENATMIMTTIPDPNEQSAGECMYIAREAMVKCNRVLAASVPRLGMYSITAPLTQAFTDMGGTLMLDTTADQVVFEGKRVAGVRLRKKDVSPVAREWRFPSGHLVTAPLVVLALPVWQLKNVLDMHPERSPLPQWWIKRIRDIEGERTGLFGYMVATRRPLYEKPNFLSALSTPRTGYPFQGYSPTAYTEDVAPRDRYVLITDSVCEPWEVEDKFNLMAKMESHWEDIKEMFGFEDGEVEFAYPYYTTGCDGLARKPGLTGDFKPDVEAPGVSGLFFCGDTYRGRGIGIESACYSSLLCFERITG
jgi:hypothetical protein